MVNLKEILGFWCGNAGYTLMLDSPSGINVQADGAEGKVLWLNVVENADVTAEALSVAMNRTAEIVLFDPVCVKEDEGEAYFDALQGLRADAVRLFSFLEQTLEAGLTAYNIRTGIDELDQNMVMLNINATFVDGFVCLEEPGYVDPEIERAWAAGYAAAEAISAERIEALEAEVAVKYQEGYDDGYDKGYDDGAKDIPDPTDAASLPDNSMVVAAGGKVTVTGAFTGTYTNPYWKCSVFRLNAGTGTTLSFSDGRLDVYALKVDLPNIKVTSSYPFTSLTNLRSVAGNIKITGNYEGSFTGLFYGCTNLTSIDFTTIDILEMGAAGLFGDCTNLREIKTADGVLHLGPYSLFNTFYNCKSLTSPIKIHINMPGGSTLQTFYQAGIESVEFTDDSVIGSTSTNYTFGYFKGKSVKGKNVFSTLPTSCNYMFYQASNLQEIDLPAMDMSNVTSVTNMFSNCKSLQKIRIKNLPAASSVTLKLIDTKLDVESIEYIAESTAPGSCTVSFSSTTKALPGYAEAVAKLTARGYRVS